METLSAMVAHILSAQDLSPDDVPRLDLYMDQVLTLFDEGFSDAKRTPEDKILTKTMVNNYSKEKLLLPMHGKKYSRQQVMQLLCIYMLKQELPLQDVRALTQAESLDFEVCYRDFLAYKDHLRELLPRELAPLSVDLSDPAQKLTLCLSLTAISAYMRRICEAIIDSE